MRSYIRHPLAIPIQCSQTDGQGTKARFLSNVSHGGLNFRSDEWIEPGAILRIDIDLPGPDFSIEGLVIWCNPADPATYDVGVKFEDESAEFAVRLVEQACYIQDYKTQAEAQGRTLSLEQAASEWIASNAAGFPQ